MRTLFHYLVAVAYRRRMNYLEFQKDLGSDMSHIFSLLEESEGKYPWSGITAGNIFKHLFLTHNYAAQVIGHKSANRAFRRKYRAANPIPA